MTYVVGIDQSVNHTGVCLLSTEGNHTLLTLIEPPPSLSNADRLGYIYSMLTDILSDKQVLAAVMEGYSYNSVNKKFLLGEVGGIVKLAVGKANVPLHEAAPKQLKKFITGKGSASKEEVIKAIAGQYGEEIENDNLADAYGLARIALELVKPGTSKRHQLDVLKKMSSKDLPRRKRVPRVSALHKPTTL